MAQSSHPYVRRQFFIKKNFQSRFILKFCILILIGGIISTALIFLFSQGTLTSSFNQSRLVVRTTSFAILPAAIYTNIITLVMISVATIFVTLFISHKIAGPMFRFEKEIKIIAGGDLTVNIHLRRKDQITELAEDINNMTASLNKKVTDIRTGLEQAIEKAETDIAPEKLVEELNDLHKKFEQHFELD